MQESVTDGCMDGPMDGLTDIVMCRRLIIKVNSDLVEPCLLALLEAVDDLFQHTFRVVACRRV